MNVTFTVIATNDSPLTYQWRLDGTDLAGATNASLALTNVQSTNSGFYMVLVSGGGGAVASTTAYLTIGGTNGIVSFFNDRNSLVGECDGTPATSPIVAQLYAGFSPNEYNFSAVGAPVPVGSPGAGLFNGGARTLPTAGGGIMFVQVVVWDASAASNYQNCMHNPWPPCRAGKSPVFVVRTRDPGAVPPISPATLVGAGFPGVFGIGLCDYQWFGVYQQPVSRTAKIGNTINFSIIAYGISTNALPLRYCWYKNGLVIPGAASDRLWLTNVQPNDAGYYQVMVRNTGYWEMSQQAQLSVTTPLAFESISRGTNGPIELRLLGKPGYAYSLEASTNLVNWSVVANLTNTDGAARFTETNTNLPQRYYRARLP